MPKGKRLTQEQMMAEVAKLELKAEQKRVKAVASEQRRIDSLKARLEAAQAQETDVPQVILPPEPPKMSQEEEDMHIELARQSLRMFGTVLPPKEALYTLMDAKCPSCKETKNIATEFGFKKYKSNPKDPNSPVQIRPQSWCRACRNSNTRKDGSKTARG